MSPGVNRDSHGIKVAKLAGLPPPAIAIAEEALSHIRALRAQLNSKNTAHFKDIGARFGSQ